MKLHFILFHTEGQGFDEGLDTTNVSRSFYEKVRPYMDFIHMFTPRTLIEKSNDWKVVFENQKEWMYEKVMEKEINWNKDWASINFFLWKPYLIYDVLKNEKNINEGDIVFYHDPNFEKYPDYLLGIQEWKTYLKSKLSNKSVLLFNDDNLRLGRDTKKELIAKYLQPGDEIKHHIWAGAFAVKKNEYSISFINEWLKITSELENRSQVTNYPKSNNLIWHSADQACLTVLYHQWIKKFKNSNELECVFLGRSRSIPPNFWRVKLFQLFYFIKNTFIKVIHSK